MRVFIALPLPQEAATVLADWAHDFSLINSFPLRLFSEEEMHLTIIPPWQAEENELETFKKIINKAAQLSKPIFMELNKISYGTNEDNPRLIWATGPYLPKAEELRNRIYGLLKEVNSGPDVIQYPRILTHITMIRFGEGSLGKPKTRLNEKIVVRADLSGVSLFESVPSSNGTRYKNIYLKEFGKGQH